MGIVYILKSVNNPSMHYVGFTQNLKRRLKEHNQNKEGSYSSYHAPWKVETSIAFSNKPLTESFERYLKSGSGHAFLKKRLLPRLQGRN